MNTRNWWAKETVVLVGIVLIAAFFRLYRLPAVPTGFQFDEAYNAADALRVLAGARPLFLPANAGREVLYTYLQAGVVALLGPELLALRLTSALLGILTIPATYALTRALFPRPRATALLTAALMAVSLWHVHFSRYGIRAITLPLVAIATIYTFWLGLRRVGNAPHLFALSGIFMGLAVYTHPSGRLLPFILGALALYLAWTDRARARRYLAGLVTAGLVSFVVFIPLGLYFWQNPSAFLGHPGDVSILAPRVSQGDLVGTLLDNTLRVAGMFLWRGDEFWTHNLAGRPVFDPLIGLAFLFGLGLSLGWVIGRPRDPASAPFVLILVWLGIMLLPTLLSDQAPNFSRAIGAMPAVFVLPALGLEWVASAVEAALTRLMKDERRKTMEVRPSSFVVRLTRLLARLRLEVPLAMSREQTRHHAPWLLVAVMVLSGLLTFRDYFVTFANAPQAYYDYDQDKVDAVAVLIEAARADHVYLAPLWATHATVAFLTRGMGVKSFEASQTLVLPPNDGRDAVYAFPPEQTAQMAALSARLGDLATREEVMDRYGRPLLVLYRLPARHLPTADAPWGDVRFQPAQRVEMDFGGEMRLLGYTFDPHGPAVDASVELVWQALRPMRQDYTVFVHVLDGRGERWGQVDREPGDASYRTTVWTPGEVILDRYALSLKPCAPPGEYRLVAGVYHLPTGQPLPTSRGQPGVVLGTVQLQGRAILPIAETTPQHRLDAALADLALLGYDGGPFQALAGDVLPINLYWQGQTDRVVALQVQSRESGQVWTLWQGQIAAPEGQALCQALRVRLPADLPGGSYALALTQAPSPNVGGGPGWGVEGLISLGELTVLPLARSFAPPHPQHPVSARLGDEVTLLGYDLALEERTLQVTLYWRARSLMDAGYTVFTHLLDSAGRLQSQHDGVPAEGARPTTSWAPGEVVADRHSLPVDPTAPPGEYLLEVGMYDAAWVRLPAFDAQGRRLPDDRIILGTVSLP